MAAPGTVHPRPPGSKAEYVHEVLRNEIMSGQLTAGAAVPQDEIARRLGVSITPVREALRRLESEGLISYRPHRGATVSELSQDAAHELYLLRGAIEGLCARLAADRITDAELAELHRIHDLMLTEQANGSVENLADHSRQFHDLIARAGGPAFLADHLSSIWKNHPVPTENSLWHDPTDAARFLEAHRDLLEALTARDATRAERVMIDHVELAGAARTTHQ
ncbi:GntR family transcriptional regulator [Stackebrandtia nassauensis]|uniref:Transcriptional regulator, GntR family n=1 Tax=Stackebrandtia nassauensis (strain DSM 44728 / CIP 108903 / NRRL B-16338 / NBRC 102104 / LLR-40K-21) TaxID=446470 RepID=D3PX59_STANL|nr:GntR family transcriptional regulator [Stackebrandtia nassauensis]ADD41322.1 transcriptional regulator, GntR family [Stackebrandtia nassauensis DSM 44728]